MLIIGCDFHSRFQQIAMLDTQTGEITERRLEHETGEAEQFYRSLSPSVRIGMEASYRCHPRIGSQVRSHLLKRSGSGPSMM